MIQRKMYLDKLIGFRDQQLIKVVTGIRRCGKSTLLAMFQKHLLEQGVTQEQIIAINMEDMTFAALDDAKKLHDYISNCLLPDKMNYVFLDEVQIVKDFQKAVDSLFLKTNVDLYITGSNAYLLSGELATLLSGRYVEIAMLPLSFREYLTFLGDQTELGRKFSNYLQYSSFPYAVNLKNNPDQVRDYLSGIYHTVILKDVISRRRISDPMMLESVVRFLFDNIGNLLSTSKIANTMTSSGRAISTHTVESYLSALTDSFILYKAKRYDIKGKQFLKTNDKYYLCDIGLRYFLLGNTGKDHGHILENVVYLELVRRGYEVSIGKVGNQEVDFIARKGDQLEYYQVAQTVRQQETLNRELSVLEAITDHHPKYLLTQDDDPPASFNGIRKQNVIDFLLSNGS